MPRFFEGIEKKFELSISPFSKSFFDYPETFWHQLVESAGAKILSKIENDQMRAFLLSESSLFVQKNRCIMITCGQTTLAKALVNLLESISDDEISNIFYERKNHLFPEYQRYHFFEDIRYLSPYFPAKAFRFGDEDDHHIYLLYRDKAFVAQEDDYTLEVLMHGISANMRTAFAEKDACPETIKKLHGLIPGFAVDEYFFDPAGYSLNAIRETDYYSIHVTPEKIGSYTSFETNHRFSPEELQSFLSQLLQLFEPESYDLIVFGGESPKDHSQDIYQKKRKVTHQMPGNYPIEFNHFYRVRQDPLPATEISIQA